MMDERFWRSVHKTAKLFQDGFSKAELRDPGGYRTIVRQGWLLFVPARPWVLALTSGERALLRQWNWEELGDWIEITRHELVALAPALRRWAAVRKNWHWFKQRYGMMSSFSHTYYAPGKNGKCITTAAGGMGSSRGRPFSGKDKRVALKPPVVTRGGVVIVARKVRVGETAVKLPRDAVVGEVYRLSGDLEAWGNRGNLYLHRGSPNKCAEEGSFIYIELDAVKFLCRVAGHG